MRAAFFDEARPHAPYLSVDTPAGRTFAVSTKDEGLSRKFFARRKERRSTTLRSAVKLLLALGLLREESLGTFVDIGAQIGTASVAAVAELGFKDVVACEPYPDAVRILRVNVALNGLDDRVRVFAGAASRGGGDVLLEVRPTRWDRHRVRFPEEDEAVAEGDTRSMPVPSITIDDLIAREVGECDSVGLCWIGAGGAAVSALDGASRLIAAGRPLLLDIMPPAAAWRSACEVLTAHYSEFVTLPHPGGRDGGPQRSVDALAGLARSPSGSGASSATASALLFAR